MLSCKQFRICFPFIKIFYVERCITLDYIPGTLKVELSYLSDGNKSLFPLSLLIVRPVNWLCPENAEEHDLQGNCLL